MSLICLRRSVMLLQHTLPTIGGSSINNMASKLLILKNNQIKQSLCCSDGAPTMESYKKWKNSDKSQKLKKPKKVSRYDVENLVKIIKSGHIQSAERLIKDFGKDPTFKLGVGLNMLLLDMYLKAEQVELTLETLSSLHQHHPDTAVRPSKLIELATVMIHSHMDKECLQVLEEESEIIASTKRSSTTDGSEEYTQPESPLMNKLCLKLLSVSAARGATETTQRLTEILLHYGYVKASKAMLGPTVKAHIAKQDFDGALSVLTQLAATHRILPCKPELMECLVRSSDISRVQRLVDLSTELIGLDNSLLDLVVCFIENDKLDKAVHLITESQLPLSADRLLYVSRLHLRRGRLQFLVDLLDVLRRCRGQANGVHLKACTDAVAGVAGLLKEAYDERGDTQLGAELDDLIEECRRDSVDKVTESKSRKSTNYNLNQKR